MSRSTKLVGELNKATILGALRRIGKGTVEELVNSTGVSQPTVVKWLTRLHDEGLVDAIGPGESTGGRPPMVFRFNPHAGVLLGVEIEVPRVRMGIVDLGGNLLHSESWALSLDAPEAEIRRELTARAHRFAHRHEAGAGRLRGVGVAITGFLDQLSGTSTSTPRLRGWQEVPLRQDFEAVFDAPVHLMHEIDALALAEMHLGAAVDKESFVYLEVRYGLGARVFLGRTAVRGTLGNASLVGHTTVVPDGLACICGNRGCLEVYASGRAIANQVETATGRGTTALKAVASDETLLIRTLFEEAARGSDFAVSLVDQLVYFLGIGIANTVNMFEVPDVIVGGFVTEGGEPVRARLHEAASARLQPILASSLRIGFSTVERETAGPHGAGLYTLEKDSLLGRSEQIERVYPMQAGPTKRPPLVKGNGR